MAEGFSFLGNHTSDYNLKLISRSDPSPSEKEVIESVPGMQGNYDFSGMFGERIFENRSLTYVFRMIARNYQQAKTKTKVISNWLMKPSVNSIYDDYNPNYYYRGKCSSVSFEVNPIGYADLTIEFDAYPFMISELKEGNDIWDTFNFELDVAQITNFDVEDEVEVILFNSGTSSVVPKITADSSFVIQKDLQTYNINTGITQTPIFRLIPGENELTIKGNGNIDFEFYKELI